MTDLTRVIKQGERVLELLRTEMLHHCLEPLFLLVGGLPASLLGFVRFSERKGLLRSILDICCHG